MNNNKGDSLLSNISNISGQIDLMPCDGSGFFKNFYLDIQKEAARQPHENVQHSQNLQKANLKTQGGFDAQKSTSHWFLGNNQVGMSQEQSDSSSLIQHVKIQEDQGKQQTEKESINALNDLSQLQQAKKRRIYLQKRMKNETKNIPKNYGKAIITFIQKYKIKVSKITAMEGVDYEDLLQDLRERKKTINTIADLRALWVDYKYSKCMRLLSSLFLRKYSLSYIFNSRICNYGSHIKYRYRLGQAMKEPNTFKHIKDY